MTTKVKYIADNVVTVDQIDLSTLSTSNVSEGTNLYYTDARVDSRLSSGSVANVEITGYLRGPSTFTIDPAAHGDNTGTVVIAGNLQVDGTTTTINSTTVEVDDKNIVLASGAINAAAADGAGITVDGASATLTYNSTDDAWSFNKSLGIGTSSVGDTLHVYETDTSGSIRIGGGNGSGESRIYIQADGSSSYIDSYGDNAHKQLSIQAAPLLFNTSGGGNVGINVSNPTSKLEVGGTLTTSGSITQNSAGHAYFNLNSGGAYESGIIFKRASVNKWEAPFIGSDNDNLKFYSYPGSALQLQIRDGVDGNGGTIISGAKIPDAGATYYGSYGSLLFNATSSYTSGARGWMLTNAYKAANFALLFSNSATSLPVLTTGGNEGSGTSVALDVDISGNIRFHSKVGIGTHSTSNNLEIYSALGSTAKLTAGSNGAGGLLFSKGDSGIAYITNVDNYPLYFGANNTPGQVVLTEAGHLLVNDSSSRTSDPLQVRTNASGGGQGIYISRNDSNADQGIGRILFGNSTDNDLAMMAVNTDGSVDSGRITFWTQGAGQSMSEKVRITSTGKVGIGTSDPTTKLNIDAGTGTANGNVAFHIGGPSNYPSIEMGIGPDTYAGFLRSYGNDLHYYSGHWQTVGTTSSENHSHYWYTSKSGSNDWSTHKMRLNHEGILANFPTLSGDTYGIRSGSQTGGDNGLSIFRASGAGFGIAVRTSTTNYAEFLVSGGGEANFSEGGTTNAPIRIYQNNDVTMPASANWQSSVGHQFFGSGLHYIARNATSTGAETFIINNLTSPGAVGVLQYRENGGLRGDYLIATSAAGIYFSSSSDYRFKENVTTIEDDILTKITNLRPVTYTHSSAYDSDTSRVHKGFIAHEIQEVFPELVEGEKDAVWTEEELQARGDSQTITESPGDPKYQTVSYSRREWTLYFVKAIQQLKEENDALRARLDAAGL